MIKSIFRYSCMTLVLLEQNFDTMWRTKQSPFLMFMSFIKNEVEALIYVTGDC